VPWRSNRGDCKTGAGERNVPQVRSKITERGAKHHILDRRKPKDLSKGKAGWRRNRVERKGEKALGKARGGLYEGPCQEKGVSAAQMDTKTVQGMPD